MYLVSGTFFERPQENHVWTNMFLTDEQVRSLDLEKMVHCNKIDDAYPALPLYVPLHHLPAFGGWKNYVVIVPDNYNDRWCVGWVTEKRQGFSRMQISGPVRMLLGDEDVQFFGVGVKDDSQISIKNIGEGWIGDGGIFKDFPLL